MRTARIVAIAGVTVAVMAMPSSALAGGGGGGSGGPCQAYASGDDTDATEIVLQDNCFGPVSATAGSGSTVTIRNEGQQPHSYTAVDGTFDTGVLGPGRSTTIDLPSTSGTLPVYCTLHADPEGNGMAGTITLAATTTASAGSMDLGSSALLLAGGFVLGTATVAMRRRREDPSDADVVVQ